MSEPLYDFEDCTLDCVRGALLTADGEVALRPKIFAVLRFLIENAGRLVSRDELLNAIWPDTMVTEESLTQCISEARRILGDTEQRAIKTVPKRGYLFASTVSSRPSSSREAESGPAADERRTSVIAADPSLQGPSVVVLPFANVSGDASQGYLSDGITDDIINGLSYFSELSVIARNSSFVFKGRAVDVREVGRELNVRHVVEGSVRKTGDRIRITAQLIDAKSGVQRWAERFDRVIGDIFSIQDDITRSIVRIVVSHLSQAEIERVSEKPPTSWTSYDLTLRGDQAWRALEQTWTEAHLFEARRLFDEAFKADPESARICARLALTYIRAYADPAVADFGNPDDLKCGYDLARKAVSLDPNLPFARSQLGWAYFWMAQQDAAEEEFKRAIAFNPNFSNFHYPAILVFGGKAATALDVLQAHLRLDPFHPPQVHAVHGHALYMLRRYDDAVAPLSECIRRGPQVVLGQIWLAATLVRLNRPKEARALAAEARARAPRFTLRRWPALSLYRNTSDAEHMIEALREAGFPAQ